MDLRFLEKECGEPDIEEQSWRSIRHLFKCGDKS
jgi:hypothetical protein